jgi:protein phosphatase
VIVTNHTHLYVAAATHAGMKGKNNEDRYAISAHRVGSQDPTPSLLAVICDGIGGHRAGEVAAEIAVNTITRRVAESDGQRPTAILNDAIIQASKAVHAQSIRDPAQAGMGATCVCIWVIGDRLFCASVGDSRLYLIRNGTIQQVTTDHTWVQEAVEAGALTPEQAKGHPNAHVIRRYLGSSNAFAPDFRLKLNGNESNVQAEANQGTRLHSGDQLLLCSDGLTDLVDNEEILAALQTQKGEAALNSLVNLANSRGGHDNITAIGLEVPANERTIPLHLPQRRKRSARLAISCLVLLALMAVFVVLGLLIWFMLTKTQLFGGQVVSTPNPTTALTLFPATQTTATGLTVQPTAALTKPSTALFTVSSTMQPSAAGKPTATVTLTPTITPSPTVTLTYTPAPPTATYTPWPFTLAATRTPHP